MTYSKRTDANQQPIVDDLRKVGATVTVISGFGHGVPDLLVGYRGKNYLLEVKTETGEFTKREKEWFGEWQGQASVVRNITEALWEIGAIECLEK